jgi:hypothetical protein
VRICNLANILLYTIYNDIPSAGDVLREVDRA